MKGIYQIKNIQNNKLYIGQSIDIIKRFQHHKSDLNTNKHYNKHLQAAWIKYGEQSFEFSILEEVEDINVLNDLEIYYIEYLDTFYNGYNQTDGGSGVGSGVFNPNYNPKEYNFYHHSGKEELNISFLNFINKYNLVRESVYRMFKNPTTVYCGWALNKEAFNISKYIKRTWYNIDGRVEVDMNAVEMYDKHKLTRFSQTVEGKYKSCGGWSLEWASQISIDKPPLKKQNSVDDYSNDNKNAQITLYDRCGNSYKNITKDKLREMLVFLSKEAINKASINSLVWGIFSGKLTSCKGLYVSNPLTTDVKTFINDDGDIVENINIDQFIKLSGGVYTSAYNVWSGIYKSTNGWRVLDKINIIQPPKLQLEDFGDKYSNIIDLRNQLL